MESRGGGEGGEDGNSGDEAPQGREGGGVGDDSAREEETIRRQPQKAMEGEGWLHPCVA